MYKRLIISTILSTLLALAPSAVVLAAETATDAPKRSTEEIEAQKQRITKNKEALKTKLTAAQALVLKGKCKAAQLKSTTLATDVAKKNVDRKAAYEAITKSIKDITTRLKDANYDTATLETQSTELQKLIDAYNKNFDSYKTALADVNEIDCEADPDGFKASLEVARTSLAALAKDAAAIRSYLNETIKKTLKDAKESLGASAGNKEGTQ